MATTGVKIPQAESDKIRKLANKARNATVSLGAGNSPKGESWDQVYRLVNELAIQYGLPKRADGDNYGISSDGEFVTTDLEVEPIQ